MQVEEETMQTSGIEVKNYALEVATQIVFPLIYYVKNVMAIHLKDNLYHV